MLIRFTRTTGDWPAGGGSGAAGKVVESATSWRLDRYEPDVRMHRVEWDSVEAICLARTAVAGDRLPGFVNPLAEDSPRFEGLADLLDLVILFAPRRERVTVYSSPSLHRYVYFTMEDAALTFADRLSTLRASGTRFQLNEQVVPEFLSYRFVVPPATLIRGVRKVPPGCCMTLELSSGRLVRQVSTLPEAVQPVDRDRAARDLDLVLRAEMSTGAVQLGRGGVLLSGGMDSTLLASVLCAQAGETSSYSTGFEAMDPGNREVEYARTAAAAVGSRHRHVVLTPHDFLDAVIDATAVNEEPIHHLQSAALMHLFTYLEREHGAGDPIYCGEAADGLFGNDTHDLIWRRGWIMRPMGWRGMRGLRTWARRKGLIPRRFGYLERDLDAQAESLDHIFWSMGRYVSTERLEPFCTCRPEEPISGRRELVRAFPAAPLLDQVSYLSFLTEGFTTMAIWSRLAASRGRHMAYPFAAPGCLKVALGMPWSYKLSARKAPVNELLASYGIPDTIRERPKLSFGFRSACWAPPGALLQPLIDSVCRAYDAATIRRLQEGNGTDAMLLWNVVALELWSRLILEGTSPDDLKAAWREAQPQAARATGGPI